ncbi:MAG: hypothetical protein OXU85_07175 [Thaumarchaeota archaeon]|nr:hypothetical protein [Nitrososphaerota archaeon]
MRAAAAIALAAALAIACAAAHDADAAPVRKLHFTSTYTSYPDPSGANATVAMVLPPSEGTIYVGSLTYAASSPAQVVVLHELHGPPGSLPSWGVPGQDAYAASRLGANATAGSFGFAGTAVLLRGAGPFVATASVDTFARGQPAEIRTETIEVAAHTPEVRLVRAEVPVTLPLHEGILGGERVLYAITESSDAELAARLSGEQGRPVTHAAPLAALLEEADGSGGHEPPRVYAFRNGVKGGGLEGYQHEVFEAGPGDRAYSPASELVYAEWRRNLTPEVLASAEEVGQAVTDGRVSLEEPGIVLNLPPVSWPGGEIPVGRAGAAGGADKGDGKEGGDGADGGSGDGGDSADPGDDATGSGGEETGNEKDNGAGGAQDNGDSGDGEMDPSGEKADDGEKDSGDTDPSGGEKESGDGSEQDASGERDDGATDPKTQGEGDAREGDAETDVVVPEAYQASEVNVEEMTATFVARRAWGPDGQTIYHLMAGAAPSGPARVTGTADAPGMQNYTATAAVADLHYFRGGLAGDGALGSQPSVASAVPGDEGYTPLWRVHVVEWADADAAAVVETRDDIDHLDADGAVTVSAARPLGLDLVVNAPIVDPFWEPEEDG